jgi:hypothetical protein
MRATLPVAIHTNSAVGYFLIDGAGVSFHGIRTSEPLFAHEGIWCLFDSHDNVETPAFTFFRANTWIIRVTPPQTDRFHNWITQYDGRTYIMDSQEDEELGGICSLSVVLRNSVWFKS